MRRRKRSLKVDTRNESVLKRIKELKSGHPFWGYRRIWANLVFGEDKLKINKKRGLRLLRGLNLMSDNGSQLTSTRFISDYGTLRINQVFTSYNNPKGNADTERMFRMLKEKFLWLQEWHSPVKLGQKLEKWIADYNATYLHSSLGYKSPETFEELYCESQSANIEVA